MRVHRKILAAVAAGVAGLVVSGLAEAALEPGARDRGFHGGYTQTRVPGGVLDVVGSGGGHRGGVLVGGVVRTGVADGDRFVVLKYTARGRLDRRYGGRGRASGGSLSEVLEADFAVSADGRAVFASTGGGLTVTRFTRAGRPDRSFGEDSRSTSAIQLQSVSVVLQPDGKVLVAGGELDPDPHASEVDVAVLRFDTDGSLDEEFGDSGVARIGRDGVAESAAGLALARDGRIVVAGQSTGQSRELVARLLPNGDRDPSFAGSGVVLTNIFTDSANQRQSRIENVAVDHRGRIVVAGAVDIRDRTSDFMAARFTADGRIDPRFASGRGYRTVSFPRRVLATASEVALDGAGRILLAGTAQRFDGTHAGFALARLTGVGKLDAAFARRGRLVSTARRFRLRLGGFSIQPGGKLLAAGTARRSRRTDAYAVRFRGGGARRAR